MKNILLTLLILCLGYGANAQSEEKVFYNEDGVTISSTWKRCVDKENGTDKGYYLLQIDNANDYGVEVSFSKTYYRNGNCTNCSEYDPEFEVKRIVSANNSIMGECKTQTGTGLEIFDQHFGLPNDDSGTKTYGVRLNRVSVKKLEK